MRDVIADQIKRGLANVTSVVLGSDQNISCVKDVQALAFPVHALVLGIRDELGKPVLFILIALLHVVLGAQGVHVELIEILGEQGRAQKQTQNPKIAISASERERAHDHVDHSINGAHHHDRPAFVKRPWPNAQSSSSLYMTKVILSQLGLSSTIEVSG